MFRNNENIILHDEGKLSFSIFSNFVPANKNSLITDNIAGFYTEALNMPRHDYGDGCGYTVLGPESGTFTSINYPHAYPNSTVCEWEIRVKPEQRVQLKFGDFDIDDSDSCHFNYVRIYNGIGPTRTEI
ncbi:hypothetical protein L345_15826, partial [Ophiophagus hannah]